MAQDMISMKANPKYPHTNGWQDRHNAAVTDRISVYASVESQRRQFETAMVRMLENWAQYALDHHARYDSVIGDDGVLGAHWQAIGLGIRGLLNGNCGPRLDCGTLDGFILKTLAANGCTEVE